jgi:hypothetical protein
MANGGHGAVGAVVEKQQFGTLGAGWATSCVWFVCGLRVIALNKRHLAEPTRFEHRSHTKMCKFVTDASLSLRLSLLTSCGKRYLLVSAGCTALVITAEKVEGHRQNALTLLAST